MKLSPAPVVTAGGLDPPGEVGTRLHGRWLVIARILWVALVLLAFGLLAISLPRLPQALAQLQAPCLGQGCTGGLSPDALRTLRGFGVTASAFAAFYAVVFALIPLVVWVTVGALLAWRKSDDWMALLVSLFFILFQVSIALFVLNSNGLNSNGLALGAPWWLVLFYPFCQSLAYPVFALFPNGRFVPRWMLWPVIALVASEFLGTFFPSNAVLNTFGPPIALGLVICLVGSMIYRYWRGSTLLERQQIKWLAFIIALDVLLNWIGPQLLSLLFPQSVGPGSLLRALYELLWPLTFLGVPIAVSIAILRYRLWDVDLLIKRTLVYGSLTGLLVAVYVGLIIGLQALVSVLTGQISQSPVVIVISTLAIAALFQPLRHRIQNTIDRRFYRRKYDAARTLAAFSATLRNEVDLEQLRDHLLAVVQETMQPAHVSLWLRQPQHPEKSSEHMPS